MTKKVYRIGVCWDGIDDSTHWIEVDLTRERKHHNKFVDESEPVWRSAIYHKIYHKRSLEMELERVEAIVADAHNTSIEKIQGLLAN